jgi:hypothetical protein
MIASSPTLSEVLYLPHDADAQALAAKHSLQFLNVTWEDKARCISVLEGGCQDLFFNYPTWEDNARCISVLEGGCQDLFFNNAGYRTRFMGQQLTDNRLERDAAGEGEITVQERQDNCVMAIQVPLKRRSEAVARFEAECLKLGCTCSTHDDGDGGSEDDEVASSSSPADSRLHISYRPLKSDIPPIHLDMEGSDSVGALRARIAFAEAVFLDDFELYFNGEKLLDEQSLRSCRIRSKCWVVAEPVVVSNGAVDAFEAECLKLGCTCSTHDDGDGGSEDDEVASSSSPADSRLHISYRPLKSDLKGCDSVGALRTRIAFAESVFTERVVAENDAVGS